MSLSLWARASRAVRTLTVGTCASVVLSTPFSLASEPAGENLVEIASVAHENPPAPRGFIGHASWYGARFANRPTASGELFDPEKLTAAHRKLPLGTKVRVTNLHNGRSVQLTITDRGPYWPNRDIDVSYRAARVLGMVRRGVARVRIEPL